MVRDRVAQEVIRRLLAPIFEPRFDNIPHKVIEQAVAAEVADKLANGELQAELQRLVPEYKAGQQSQADAREACDTKPNAAPASSH